MTQQLTGDRIAYRTTRRSDDYATVLAFHKLNWAEESFEHLFEKVERAKREWETTADSLPELICLVDHDGHVIRANRTIEAWGLGLVTAVQGLDLHDLIHPGCASLFCILDRFLQQAIKKASRGQPDELETEDAILRRYLHVRVQPVSARKQAAVNTSVVVVQDISERKKAAQALLHSNQRLEVMNDIQKAILAARSPEAIAQAALSRIRRLVPFHQACLMLFDPGSDEFFVLVADANGGVHLRPGQSLPGEAFKTSEERRPDRFFAVRDLRVVSEPSTVEQQLLSDGIRTHVSIPLIAEGEFIGLLSLGSCEPDAFNNEHIGTANQVSDLLAIAARQARLDDKLKQANRGLQEALEAKDQIIHNVSHELRTPLAMIYGYTELLAEAVLGPLTAEQQRAIQVMHRQGERLRFMVDRLLVLQTFDTDRLRLVRLDLGEWLPQTMRTWETSEGWTASGIQFQLELPGSLPPLRADPELLGQVILNLLDNAAKFSPQGSPGRVRAWAENDQIIIAVSDEGVGISPEKLPQLFEPFYQVDGSSTRHFGGMGIGLALCRIIAEAHGGRIWAESSGKGQGSTFYIALPVDDRKED